MAATRKTVVTETVETAPAGEIKKEDSEIVVTGDDVDTFEQDLIAELLAAGIEEEITYSVKRIAPADKAAYCCKYSRGDLSLDRIREDWGAGTYTITAFDATNKYRKRVTQKIAESMKQAAVPVSQTTQLAEMAAILRANQPPVVPTGTDLTQVILGMMNSQATMLTAIMNRPIPIPPPPPDPLAMIAALKDVLKPSKESSDIDILLKGLTLGKELGGGSEWTDVVTKGLDAVVPLFANRQSSETPPPRPTMRPRPPAPATARQLAQPNPKPVPAAETAPDTEGLEGENVDLLKKINWLRRQAEVLCHQAAADKNPGLYAEVFLDNLPDFFTLEEVHEQLYKPDAVDQLGKLHAPVLEYRQWFENFRQECLALIEEEEEEDKPDDPSVVSDVPPTVPQDDGTSEGPAS